MSENVVRAHSHEASTVKKTYRSSIYLQASNDAELINSKEPPNQAHLPLIDDSKKENSPAWPEGPLPHLTQKRSRRIVQPLRLVPRQPVPSTTHPPLMRRFGRWLKAAQLVVVA